MYKRQQHDTPQNVLNTEDGLKIETGNEWVHLRKSNTEPIVRIYAEGPTADAAGRRATAIMEDIRRAAGL